MSVKSNILIIEDEKSIRWVLEKTLSRPGYHLYSVKSAEEGWGVLRSHPIDVALIDIHLPGRDGLSSMKEMLKEYPTLLAIIMTGQNTMQNTIEAMKMGAYDYIAKPFHIDDVERLVDQALKLLATSRGIQPLQYRRQGQEELLVGTSQEMRDIYKAIGRVAPTDLIDQILFAQETRGWLARFYFFHYFFELLNIVWNQHVGFVNFDSVAVFQRRLKTLIKRLF